MKLQDVVTFTKNGIAVPAIVLRSQTDENGEHLALLFADPNLSNSMVLAGQTSKIGSVEFNVRPLPLEGTYGWSHFGGDDLKEAPATTPAQPAAAAQPEAPAQSLTQEAPTTQPDSEPEPQTPQA